MSQLRLENTELKHRLRLSQSRRGSSAVSSLPESSAAASEHAAFVRLRREFDAVKKQLSEVSAAYVSLRKRTNGRPSQLPSSSPSSFLRRGQSGGRGEASNVQATASPRAGQVQYGTRHQCAAGREGASSRVHSSDEEYSRSRRRTPSFDLDSQRSGLPASKCTIYLRVIDFLLWTFK